MLYTDIPSSSDIERLAETRADVCISVYLPTSPVTGEFEAARLEARSLLEQALEQLTADGVDKRRIAELQESIDDLLDDEPFWRYLSNSLAIFLTLDGLRTFRLPNHLTAAVEVSDRFFLKPLLRSVTFPHSAYVLALAENSVRLVEVFPDSEPREVRVPDLPSDAASFAGVATLSDRVPSGRLKNAEGAKVRVRQYARAVDRALRPLLNGLEVPLILAATEPLAPMYRATNSYGHLAEETIDGNPEGLSDAELAAAARGVLDGIYRARIDDIAGLIEDRTSSGRVARDLGDIARAATFGAVDTLLVDIDRHVPGTVDEQTGVVTLSEDGEGDATDYGVVDEIVRRALRTGARVLAVRADDIPGGGDAVAVLRYAV